MLSLLSILALGQAVLVTAASSEPAESTVQPTKTAIDATKQTQAALSPISNVKGIAFDRFVQVWLENTDYSAAAGNADQKYFASQGISLTNYYAVSHPSEPNYAAVVAGDYFGMENDDFHAIPANVSTVVDLLDTKGISWAEYQESLPYAGYQGFNYSNQLTFANDYVRKHNPLILFQSITNNASRLSLIKNFTSLGSDIAQQTFPQWSFITPNMTNDGHDTNVTFASSWERSAAAPLLSNPYFLNNTLVLLTFDESETYTQPNKVFAVLLGGAIPDNLKGTTDNTFYNHYSTISTVSLNWGLPSLGRWDCEANVFALVANKTGYKNANVDVTNLYFNVSYPGPLSNTHYVPTWPQPNTGAVCAAGNGVLASIKSTWGNASATYNYTNVYPYDAASNNNNGGTLVSGGHINGSATSSSPAATSSKAAGVINTVNGGLMVAAGFAMALFM